MRTKKSLYLLVPLLLLALWWAPWSADEREAPAQNTERSAAATGESAGDRDPITPESVAESEGAPDAQVAGTRDAREPRSIEEVTTQPFRELQKIREKTPLVMSTEGKGLTNLPVPGQWENARVRSIHWSAINSDDQARQVTLIEPEGLPFTVRVEELLYLRAADQQAFLDEPLLVRPRQREILAEELADHLMVRIEPGRIEADLQAALQTIGAEIVRPLSDRLGIYRVALPEVTPDGAPQAIAELVARPEVRRDLRTVETDGIVRASDTIPNDPRYPELWGMPNINAPAVWDDRTSATRPDGEKIIIGVIDTGVNYNHPDLADNMWTNPNPGSYGSGITGDVHGINALAMSGDPMDDQGHGTHVAGTVAAVGNNNTGVVGVAWDAEIMALKFLGADGSGTIGGAVTCLDYAIEHGAHLTNNSWGGGPFTQSFYDLLEVARDQGQLFVAAAGNSANNNSENPSYPASYEVNNIVAVAATTSSDNLASFSSYGPDNVLLGAPGLDVLSAYFEDPWYRTFSGTSMASPHVAGAAALLMAEFEDESYEVIKARLAESARQLPALQGRTITEGTLDLEQAFQVAEDGNLNVRVTVRSADDGSVVFEGEDAVISLTVTDLVPVSGATITATADPAGPDGESITFVENVDAPGSYSADYTLPTFAEGETREMDVSLAIDAAGKNAFTDTLSVEIQTRPANRFFADALELDATDPGTTVINNTFAETEPDEVGRIDFARYARSLWYKWTPDTVGSVEINTIGSERDGEPMETALAVYTSDVDNPTLADLDKVAENAYIELFVNMASRVTFDILEPGTTYYIQAADTFRPGDLMLNVIPVFGSPMITEAPPASFQVFEGLPIRINGFMAGADTFQWLKDGAPLSDGGRYSGTQSPNLVIDPAIASDAGTYVLRGTNSEGSTDTEGTTLTVTEPSGLSSWSPSEPGPTGNDLGGVAVGAGLTVAVGGEGTLLSRDETGTWSRVSTGTSARLNGIVFDAGDGFVAVGDLGTILRSSDGSSWTTADSGTDQALRSVAFGNGVYIAVGGDHLEGSILRSTDGETWTDVTPTGLDSILYSVTWDADGNRFVAVGGHWQDEAGIVMDSGDGLTWSTHSVADIPTLHAVAANGGDVVAAGGDWLRPVLLHNTGGSTWETRESPSEETLYSVGYGNALWVATGERGTLLTSSDALNWSARETGTDFALRDAVWDGGEFVAVGDGGLVLDSSDAAAWNVQVPGVRASLEDVSGGAAGLLTVGENGSVIFSPDGQDWTPQLKESTARYLGVATDGSLFVKSGDDGAIYSSSDAGESWTARWSKPRASIDAVVRSGGLYVAVGSDGTIVTSGNGTSWTERNSGTSAHLRSVAHSGDAWRAVGADGTILASSSGTSWSPVASGIEATLRGVTHNGLVWVAVGDGGGIWASTDGNTWEEVPSPVTRTLYAVSSDADTTFAVGARGTLLTSTDGLVWEQRDTRVSTNLLGTTQNNGLLIAVGGMGTILSTVALPIVETPEISPELTGSADSVSVTIETDTDGAEIRYTLDGSVPTGSSLRYTDSFVLNEPATVRARAFKSSMEPSAVAERTYLIEAAPFIRENAEDLAIVTGGSGVLSPEVLGETPLSYQWQTASDPEGVWSDLSGETDRELSFSNAQSSDAGYYRVQVTNNVDTATSDPVQVWVWDAPAITQDPQDVDAASGSSASFTVSTSGGGPLSYQWRKDGEEISGATGASYDLSSATLGSAGSYDVVVSSPVGEATSGTATLTVGVPPRIATHPQSQTLAEGADVTLTVDVSGAGLSYQWQVDTGAGFSDLAGETDASLALNAVTSADEGAYRVVVENAYGTRTSEAADLTILEAPTITSQPVSMEIIEGQGDSFSVVAEGAEPLSYTWFKDGIAVPGGDSDSLAFNSVTASDGADYQVQVLNEVGHVLSDPASLTVLFPATITTQPTDQDVEMDQDGTFTVAADGTDLTYQWQENVDGSWQDLSSATGASFTVNSVAAEDDGRAFRVVVDNAYGPAETSASATLNVLAPVNITAQPQSQSIELNDPVTFSVTAEGDDLSYQWRRNGSNISGATDPSYTIASVDGDRDGDTYSVRVSNAVSSETSSAATLTVLFPPTILAQPQSRTVSAGETVSFSVLAEGSGTLAYQWSKDGVDLTGENADTLTLTDVQEADAGSYQVNVSNSYGDVDSVAVDLNILASFDFEHGIRITFDGYTESETLLNFPVPVKFEEDPTIGFSYDDFVDAVNGSDLRFWNATLDQQLVYEIEEWDQNGASYVWVRIPELSPDTVIYASWGDDQADSVPESPANTWSEDFLAAWHFQDDDLSMPSDSATLESDNSGFPNTSNTSAPAESITGLVGPGLKSVKGISHRVQISNHAHLAERGQATFSFWYRRDVDGGRGSDFLADDTTSIKRRIGHFWAGDPFDDGIAFYPRADSGTINAPDLYSGTLPLEEWRHVAITQDKTSSNRADFRLYIDGEEVDTALDRSLSTSDRWILEPNYLLGSTSGVTAESHETMPNSSFDEMRMAGTVRSTAWIKAEYLSMSDPQTFGTQSPLNDIPNLPIITLTQPLANEVRIPENVGLRLDADVTEAVEDSGNLTYLWEVLSGPSGAMIESPESLETAAFFPELGEYTLRLLVENSEDPSLSAQELVTVIVTDEVNEAEPLVWTGTDMGDENGGSHVWDGEVLELSSGGGGRIGGLTTDTHFVHTPLQGDGTLTVRITQFGTQPGITEYSRYAQTGLMMIPSLNSSGIERFAQILSDFQDAGNLYTHHYVASFNDDGSALSASYEPRASAQSDYWFRLTREGDTVSASLSNDGENWTIEKQQAFSTFGDTIYAGFFLSGWDEGQTARFSDISTSFGADPDNIGPTVSAGADFDGVRDESVSLSGTVEDDGFPATPGETTLQWIQTEGPAVSLSDATVLDPSFTPTENGTYSFRLLAFDGEVTTLDDVTVTVQGSLPPVFTSDPVTDAVVGEGYSYTITFTGGEDESLTLSSPGLPDWLSLSPGSDVREWILSGTPADLDEGVENIQLTASDATSQATQDFAITVWPEGTVIGMPEITLQSPGDIEPTTADLHAELLRGDEPVSVKVWYGPSDGGSDGSAWAQEQDLGTQSVGNIAATLTGLTEESTYYYRFVATNGLGEAQTATDSFTTPQDLSDIQPQISLVRPTLESVRIPEGVGLVLETEVTETGGDSGQVTLLWEQTAGAGSTTWDQTDTAETVAWFSAQGEYTLRLTADNSVNSDVLEIAVEVVDPALVTSGDSGTPTEELLLLVDFSSSDTIGGYVPPSDGSEPQNPNADGNGHYWNTIHRDVVGNGNTAENLQTSDGGSSAISLFMSDGIGNPSSSDHWTAADPARTVLPAWVPSDVADANNPLDDRANIGNDVGLFTLSGLPDLSAGETYRIEVVSATIFDGAGDNEPGRFNLEAANSTGGNASGNDVGSIVPTNGLTGDALVWGENSGSKADRFGFGFNSRTDVDMGADIPNQGWIVWEGIEADNGEISIHATAEGDDPRAPVNALAVYIVTEGNQNIGPLVDAGADQTVETGTETSLTGTVQDDGQPEEPGSVVTEWIQVSGPETITLSDPSGLTSTFTPTTSGETVLRLLAFDGEVATADETSVTAEGDTTGTPYEQWLDANNLDPETDTVLKDGREVTPEEAYLLGDDPGDPNDVIRITELEALSDGETMRLHFPSLENREYHVEHTDDLTSDSWTTDPEGLSGDGQSLHFDVPMAGEAEQPRRFYRIRVTLPD
ncbi:MAG: DUF2341 domain-containing protein [Opitutales bacterium]